jgi:hypothetical protein
MKTELEEILRQVGRQNNNLERNVWWEKNQKEDIFKKLKDLYPFADSVREMIYLKLNNMSERPKCPNCGTEIKPPKERMLNGFAKHCSRSCQVIVQQSNIDTETKRKRNSKAGKISYISRDPSKNALNIVYWIKKYGEDLGVIKYDEFKSKATFSKQTCIEKYGPIEGLRVWEERQTKWQQTLKIKSAEEIEEINKRKNGWAKLDEVERSNRINNIKRTMRKNGHWYDWDGVDSHLFTDYELYSMKVRKLTEKNDLSILPNHDKRGRNTYHLDHKFSILEGFKQNASEYIIASIHNLEFIPATDNIIKSDKCSIKLETLINQNK